MEILSHSTLLIKAHHLTPGGSSLMLKQKLYMISPLSLKYMPKLILYLFKLRNHVFTVKALIEPQYLIQPHYPIEPLGFY